MGNAGKAQSGGTPEQDRSYDWSRSSATGIAPVSNATSSSSPALVNDKARGSDAEAAPSLGAPRPVRPVAHVEGSMGEAGLELRAKRALVKAFMLELAGRCAASASARRKADGSVEDRPHRTSARLQGEIEPAFKSPRPRGPRPEKGSGDKGQRHLVPAMVLPRWESLEVFKPDSVEVLKLQLLEGTRKGTGAKKAALAVAENGTGAGVSITNSKSLPDSLTVSVDCGIPQIPQLACTVCLRPTGGGESILALPCAHVFCPICFEAFLRRRWAELAAQTVDSSETEQIPCPQCGVSLHRQDVHTLTQPEVVDLCARVVQARSTRPRHKGGSPSPGALTRGPLGQQTSQRPRSLPPAKRSSSNHQRTDGEKATVATAINAVTATADSKTATAAIATTPEPATPASPSVTATSAAATVAATAPPTAATSASTTAAAAAAAAATTTAATASTAVAATAAVATSAVAPTTPAAASTVVPASLGNSAYPGSATYPMGSSLIGQSSGTNPTPGSLSISLQAAGTTGSAKTDGGTSVPSTPSKTGEAAASLIASPSTSATGPAPMGPAAAAASTIAATVAAASTPKPTLPVPRASSYVASPAKHASMVASSARVRGSSAAPSSQKPLSSLEESPAPPPTNGAGVAVATHKLHSLTSMSKRIPNGPSVAGGPAGPLSPVGAYRTQAQVVVQPASASSLHQKPHPHGTPPQPHRSVSMPIQPADLRGLPSAPLSAANLNSGNSVAPGSMSPSESASAAAALTSAAAGTTVSPLTSAVPPAPAPAGVASSNSTSGALPSGMNALSLPLSTPTALAASAKPPVGRPEHSRAFNVGEGLRRSLPLDGSFRSSGTRASVDGAQKAVRQLNQPMLAASSLPMSSYAMASAIPAGAAAPLAATAPSTPGAQAVTHALPSSRAHR